MPSRLKEEWTSLFAGTLEMWCHQLLYVLGVYPKESFAATNFLGVRCHANRHPDVAKYITETLKVTVPSLLSGSADEVTLVVKKNAFETLDTYSIRVSQLPTLLDTIQEEQAKTLIRQVERAMRNLILSVHSLQGARSKKYATLGDDASFLIRMRTSSNSSSSQEDAQNEDLTRAVSEGLWYSPDDNTAAATVQPHPLQRVRVPSCGLEINHLLRISSEK